MNISALFLAAGFATRLYPLTQDRAKPLLRVGGAPMLTRILRQVERCDAVQEGVVVANARFYPDFQDWAAATTSRIRLRVVDDGASSNDERLGAIRDLALALEHTPGDADGYLVLACDNLFEFEFDRLVQGYATTRCAQLIVREVEEPVPPSRYSEVVLDGDHVRSFREKPSDPNSNLSAIAAYLLPADLPELIATYLRTGGEPDAPGHFLAWLRSQRELLAHRLTGQWWDIGSHVDLEAANRAFGSK